MKFRVTLLLLFCLCLCAIAVAQNKAMILRSGEAPPDTTAPVIVSVSVNAAIWTVTYNENVTGQTGFSGNGSSTGAKTLTGSAGDGTSVHTFLANEAASAGETLTYDYTPGNAVDAASNALAAVDDGAATNGTTEPPGDTDPPELESVSIGYDGETWTFRFSENVTGTAGFTGTGATTEAITLTYVSGQGTDTYVYTGSEAVAVDEAVNVDYSGTAIKDAADNELAAISDRSVTNNTSGILPIAPETYDTTYTLPDGDTITVGSDGGDDYDTTELQDAIDAASPGDVIVLRAGDTFTGNFVLPEKEGEEWIYIISSALASLPEGTRVDTGDTANMATLAPSNTSLPVLRTNFGAHHYRVAGIEVKVGTSDMLDLIRTGYGVDEGQSVFTIHRADTTAEQPRHIVFDRMLIHSTSDAHELRHGIMLNGHYMTVKDSYIANVKDGSDAQAIWTFEGDGPYQIVNNFLEATGENYLTGGTDPTIANDIPSDIEFVGNHLYKRLDWYPNLWTVKNLFELKNSERHIVDGNIMENCWTDGQSGCAILFTVRNQSGTAPWSRVRDVDFTNNLIRNVHQGFGIAGDDDLQESEQTMRIRLHNNVVEDLNRDYGSSSFFISFSADGASTIGVTVTSNLCVPRQTAAPYPANDIRAGHARVVIENAIIKDNIYAHGSFNTPFYPTNPTSYATNLEKSHNVIIMENESSRYSFNKDLFATYNPSDLMSDEGVASVGFEDFPNDYRLATGSQWKGDASDGGDPGPDHDELDAALSGVEEDDLP